MIKPTFDPMPLRAQAVSILKEAIISGELHDGEVMTERTILEKYNIGKTPFREAIQTLEAEGWVKKIPYKGTFVTPLTEKGIHDLFELRLYLETSILKHWQRECSPKALHELNKIQKEMEKSSALLTPEVFMQWDKDFHQVIYHSTLNDRIIAIYDQIKDHIRRIGLRVIHHEQRREEVIQEHRAILTGLTNGRAEEAMEQHLLKQKATFLKLLSLETNNPTQQRKDQQ
ncbi:DNA-binding GntR family transcriptional regulator [Pullulanibacillus pueri]|uniref:Methycitrate-responsive transcriptional regulator of methylisocitrate utilization PrpR n=1 Tax=Pullulanibacillus pueri TaxID=1437324 RepID=A0A8J2ZZL8_9BACL|nr:GntR family transcriptional regulator [Pullulanibacillus pueri]MBM7684041.1 DNA-binding GntR family transcriptional regulator [Pullulanibacillus pueri]GGH88480.1 methycitrate-responsive transcriptional regulator of methylisocitrate utilization PrpR [Pullulanibacillus pueri]